MLEQSDSKSGGVAGRCAELADGAPHRFAQARKSASPTRRGRRKEYLTLSPSQHRQHRGNQRVTHDIAVAQPHDGHVVEG